MIDDIDPYFRKNHGYPLGVKLRFEDCAALESNGLKNESIGVQGQ